MSSDIKDARWKLAEEMATEDGGDLYSMPDETQGLYLTVAQQRLAVTPQAEIERLAAEFREVPDGG